MTIFFTILYYIMYSFFTFTNVFVVKMVYWPMLRDHAETVPILKRLFKNWKFVLTYAALYFTMVCKEGVSRIKQWWHETVVDMKDGRYMLVHTIKGRKVKIIIRPVEDPIISVVDENYDECYMDEALPFMSYEQDAFGPEDLGICKSIYVHTENGIVEKRFCKTTNKFE